MTVANFIKACARSVYDSGLHIMSAQEWLEILNFQAGELYPEVGYRGTVTGNIADLATEYQVDLNSQTDLEDVKEVYLEDFSGDEFLYDNWIYNKERKLLDLDPESSKTQGMAVSNYLKYHIIWIGYVPELTNTGADIILSPPKLVLLQKICIKEALSRILNDHAKLDRYRTLVSRMNEYALLAMIRDLTTEIELKKRRLVDTHQVRSF